MRPWPGAEPDEDCRDCDGLGWTCARWPDGEPVARTVRRCSTCEGRGRLALDREWHCEDVSDSYDPDARAALDCAELAA